MGKKIEKKQVMDALSGIVAPGMDSDVVKLGMVSSIIIKPDNNVGFAIEIDPDMISREQAENLRKECVERVARIDGVGKVTAVLTAETNDNPQADKGSKRTTMTDIEHIIVVASGKGGVGKSTVAVNLAIALAKIGYKTGLVDADILGPSVARMMGLNQKPKTEKGFMAPLEKYGIKCLSIGLLIDEDSPIVWRGPMLSKALAQLTYGADWGKLDFLVIDLPPGTGDIQISLSKHYPISAAVMVTTPQEVSLMDVKKAIGMFQRMNVPVAGIVKNMSYFTDKETGKSTMIFGKGKVEETAKTFNLPVLADIPLIPAISETGDVGKPIVENAGEGSELFLELAQKLAKKLVIN